MKKMRNKHEKYNAIMIPRLLQIFVLSMDIVSVFLDRWLGEKLNWKNGPLQLFSEHFIDAPKSGSDQ